MSDPRRRGYPQEPKDRSVRICVTDRPAEAYLCDLYIAVRRVLEMKRRLSFGEFVDGGSSCAEDRSWMVRALTDAILHSVILVGESIKGLKPEWKMPRSDLVHVPWGHLVTERHRNAHAYFDVSRHHIWNAIDAYYENILETVEQIALEQGVMLPEDPRQDYAHSYGGADRCRIR